MSQKTALITGISGQDGAYLSKLLLEKGYKVIGGDRRTSRGSLWRLEELGIRDDILITDFELAEFTNIYRVIEKFSPNEVYNLAAQSFVGASFELPTMTADITGLGVCRLLECIRKINPDIKFYQASSSEMFGKVKNQKQNENTIFNPRSPYAVSKVFGHHMTVNYRESYNLFAVSGIVFNHESPLRGEEFVTRKITSGLSRIKLGHQNVLELGNLDAKRDWGFAGDFVEGMWGMLQLPKPQDFVLATGETHSVREFVELAAKNLDINLEWRGSGDQTIGMDVKTGKTIIKINPLYYRPAEVDYLSGDYKRAKEILGWQPKVSFTDLVDLMVQFDFERVKQNTRIKI